METQRASIDIGSNSALLLAARVDEGVVKEVLANESRVTGLGRGLDKNGKFLEVAMEETFQALEEYAHICDDLDISRSDIIATATEASRVSSNAGEFFTKVKENLGITVKIITGEAEAFYSAKGILIGTESEEGLAIMDIGGASTEFITTSPEGEIIDSFSVPIGSVRMTDWISEGILENKLSSVIENWKGRLANINCETLHCVAGTMTSLANMHLGHKQYVESDVHGHVLVMSDLENMWNAYRELKPEEFLEKFPFLGKRSRAIRGGLLLAKTLGSLLGVSRFQVSSYGLRYGTLIAGEIENERIHRSF